MRTPTRIAGREAVFEFLRHKLRAYPFIYIDYLKFIIRSTYDTDLQCAKISLGIS